MGVAVMFAAFAGFYHLFSVFSKKEMNETMGIIHFTGMIAIAFTAFVFLRYIGIAGVPRRYYQFGNFDAFAHFETINRRIVTFGIVFLLMQIIPFINAIYSLIYGKRIIR